MTEIEHRLWVYLFYAGRAEAMGVRYFSRLAQWDALDPADRWIAHEFSQQEAHHALLVRQLGRRICATSPEPPEAYHWTPPEEPWIVLREIATAERLSLQPLRRMIAVGEQLGEPDLAQTYRQILADETEHVRWGHRVLRELRRQPQFAAATRAAATPPRVAQEYRRREGVVPWLALP